MIGTDRVAQLIAARPEMQFSRQTATSSVLSLFGNKSDYAIGMGVGKSLGSMPSFMNATRRFGESRFLQHRKGMGG